MNPVYNGRNSIQASITVVIHHLVSLNEPHRPLYQIGRDKPLSSLTTVVREVHPISIGRTVDC